MSSCAASPSWTRVSAVVTSSVPLAASASFRRSPEANFPVPKKKRLLNVRPPITRSFIAFLSYAGMTPIRFTGFISAVRTRGGHPEKALDSLPHFAYA